MADVEMTDAAPKPTKKVLGGGSTTGGGGVDGEEKKRFEVKKVS